MGIIYGFMAHQTEGWERQRIFRKRDEVRVKILCRLTYQGYVPHRWVWGIEERESDSVWWAQKPSRVTRTHTHALTNLPHYYRLAPALIFLPHPRQFFHHASPLAHSTSQRSLLTPHYLAFYVFHIAPFTQPHRLRRLIVRVFVCLQINNASGSWRWMLDSLCARVACFCAESVGRLFSKEWWGDGWAEWSFTGSLPPGRALHSGAMQLKVPPQAFSSTCRHIRFYTTRLDTAADLPTPLWSPEEHRFPEL